MKTKLIVTTLLALPIFSQAATLSAVAKKIEAKCGYKFTTVEANFTPLNAGPKTVEGVNLPAQNSTLFRGIYDTNGQFSPEIVLKGLFNQSSWMIGSPMHWAITQILTGKRALNGEFFPTGGLPLPLIDYLKARHMDQEVQDLLRCSPNFYTEAEANELAASLMNKYLSSLPKDKLEERYFDMKNPEYYTQRTQDIGFGNNAVDFIISTYNDQIASIYGRKILVLKDTRHRALDLGYWNFIHTGSFWDGWVDNGEVNAPGYITTDEILGYQERRDDRVRVGWGDNEPNNPIQFALYKFEYKNRSYVGIFDGHGRTCALQDSKSQKVYFCRDNWTGRIMKSIVAPPEIAATTVANQAGLMGVIAKCDNAADCKVPAEIFTWYGKNSGTAIPKQVSDAVDNVTVNGSKLLLTTAPAPKTKGTLKVISATYASPANWSTYKDNGTAAAAKFVDGKKSVVYKINHSFLGVRYPGDDAKFEIQWSCSGVPGVVNKSTMAAPAEDKLIQDMSCED
jgi:hypothetical protein